MNPYRFSCFVLCFFSFFLSPTSFATLTYHGSGNYRYLDKNGNQTHFHVSQVHLDNTSLKPVLDEYQVKTTHHIKTFKEMLQAAEHAVPLSQFLSHPDDYAITAETLGLHLHQDLANKNVQSLYKDNKWIQNIIHEPTDQALQKASTYVDRHLPPTWNVGDIDREYQQALKTPQASHGKATLQIVQGIDALEFSQYPAAKWAIFQLASQFNGIESTGPLHNPLGEYIYDRTQGARASMAALANLLTREAMGVKEKGEDFTYSELNGQPWHYNALTHVLNEEAFNQYMKHGYLIWENHPEALNRQLTTEAIQNLSFLPMWTRPEKGSHSVLMVPTAAPPTQAYFNGGDYAVQTEIARKLVIPQYESLAKMAVIRARKTGQRIPLHLTALGQGVFNNSPEILKKAMQKVHEIIKNENIDLYWHGYTQQDVDKFNQAVQQPNGSPLRVLTAEEFKQLPAPTRAERPSQGGAGTWAKLLIAKEAEGNLYALTGLDEENKQQLETLLNHLEGSQGMAATRDTLKNIEIRRKRETSDPAGQWTGPIYEIQLRFNSIESALFQNVLEKLRNLDHDYYQAYLNPDTGKEVFSHEHYGPAAQSDEAYIKIPLDLLPRLTQALKQAPSESRTDTRQAAVSPPKPTTDTAQEWVTQFHTALNFQTKASPYVNSRQNLQYTQLLGKLANSNTTGQTDMTIELRRKRDAQGQLTKEMEGIYLRLNESKSIGLYHHILSFLKELNPDFYRREYLGTHYGSTHKPDELFISIPLDQLESLSRSPGVL